MSGNTGASAAIAGQPTFGGVIGGTTLVSLVSTFVITKQQQKTELARKKETMTMTSPPQGKRNKNRNRRR